MPRETARQVGAPLRDEALSWRAARTVIRLAQARVVDAGPLIIDLDAPLVGTHWLVSYVSVIGTFAASVAPITAPTSGLILVPVGTPLETLTEAQAGWNRYAREGLYLPSQNSVIAIGGGASAFSMVLAHGELLTIPFGWMLRAIFNLAPGTAAPGPGANSIGTLTAHYAVEDNL